MITFPDSTYRLQVNFSFTFADVSEVADYIRELGITHLYLSPILQAGKESTHGYDVEDFKSIHAQLGGQAGFDAMCLHTQAVGLGRIVDIVPNHMSTALTNPYWRDVLEHGPESEYARHFDVDWLTGESRLQDKILVPLLGEQYGLALKNRVIQLARDGNHLDVMVYGSSFPVAFRSIATILGTAAKLENLEGLAAFADLFQQSKAESVAHGQLYSNLSQKRNFLLRLLWRFFNESSAASQALDAAISAINEDPDALDLFLQQQHYRLAHWRAADQDLGYRRFFDVNSLIGVRVEDENVFLDTHQRIFEWLRAEKIDGVRIDHVDGLRDPKLYLQRLRQQSPAAWVVTEKILMRGEQLIRAWPIEGTSGYDFLNIVNGLFVSPEGLASLDEAYRRIVGDERDYQTLLHAKKIAVTAEGLGSDVNRLTSLFLSVCEADRDHRDYTRAEIRHAIREVVASFTVYRTYVMPQRQELSEADVAIVTAAVEEGKRQRTDLDPGLFDFIGDVLLLRKQGDLESEFLLQFQQFTGPVMAKGGEDTALYCYNRFIAVNEVGGSPADPLVSLEQFHQFQALAQQHHPEGMVTLGTHDTKRGEDVRARLLVLSEMPDELESAVAQWFEMNASLRNQAGPDPNTEYLYYQTLIGAWPISIDRAIAYMEKATREAGEQTSWLHNDAAFEEQLQSFIRGTLSSPSFVDSLAQFVQRVEGPGRVNSLSQTLLKCTVPGIPDLYQGSELWDHRLVDPDNRTPVDFEMRKKMLDQMQNLSASEVMAQMSTGMPKLWTIQRALKVRAKYSECFGPLAGKDTGYEPLIFEGSKQSNAIGYLRGTRVAVVVPRFVLSIADGWADTTVCLSEGKWTNALTDQAINGGKLPMQELLSDFPVALLVKEEL